MAGKARRKAVRDYHGITPQKVTALARQLDNTTDEMYELLGIPYEMHLEEQRHKRREQRKRDVRKAKRFVKAVELAKRRHEADERVRLSAQRYHLDITATIEYSFTRTGHVRAVNKPIPAPTISGLEHQRLGDSVNHLVQEYVHRIQEDYDAAHEVSGIEVRDVHYTARLENNAPVELARQFMRSPLALPIDGEPQQVWDTKQGWCALEFLPWRYAKYNGFKGLTDRDTMIHILRQMDDLEGNFMYPDPTEFGVSATRLKLWCERAHVTMYALDEDHQEILTYQPLRRAKVPALVFRIMNHHFYPVLLNDQILSITRGLRAHRSNMVVCPSKAADGKPLKAKEYTQVVAHDEVQDTHQELARLILEQGVLPAKGSIRYSRDHGITSVAFGTTLHLFNQDGESARTVYNALGKQYTGQSMNSALFDVMQAAGVEIPRSTPNPHVLQLLTHEAVRACMHYGCEPGFNAMLIQRLQRAGRVTCTDIRRCYTYCMYEPLESWIQHGFNDCLEPFDGDFTKLGLYMVRTKDARLMCGDNLYSSAMLVKAHAEGIAFDVIWQLRAAAGLDKGLFRPVLDKIKELLPDQPSIQKSLANMLAGYLGKYAGGHCEVSINSSMDQVWKKLQMRYRHGKDAGSILRGLNLGEHGTYYLYGHEETYSLNEVNVPMLIQIRDHANIMLFDMINAMGGALAFRHTDCAITVDGQLPALGDGWGSYRVPDALPARLGPIPLRPLLRVKDWRPVAWVQHDVNDSREWEKEAAIVTKGGCCLDGPPGTGKSFTARSVAAYLKTKGGVAILAPTNYAALQVGGQTIHRFLGLGKDNHLSMKRLRSLSSKVRYIILDEFSMVSRDMLRLLCFAKRVTGWTFLIMGDFRQCRPVEPRDHQPAEGHYFNHPGTMYLTGANRVSLTVQHRFDQELATMLRCVEAGEGLDASRFGRQVCRRNICYTKECRKYVNRVCMEQYMPKSSMRIPADPNDAKTQDVLLAPVIGRINWRRKDAIASGKTRSGLILSLEHCFICLRQ